MHKLRTSAWILAFALVLPGVLCSQSEPKDTPALHPKKTPAPQQQKKTTKLDKRKQFVLDVVQSAVALPQPDPQDRLRVLAAAAAVVGSVNKTLAANYGREGMRIEQDLIQTGETPSASMLESGHADCNLVTSFVENIPVARIAAAEQALIGAISLCPKQAIDPARRKIEAGLEAGQIAPRALLALVEHLGAASPWSQEQFSKMFSNLPADAKSVSAEAPNFAAMYSRMAPAMDAAVVKSTGLKLLAWLGKLDDGGNRNLAVNVTTGAMKDALGEKAYNEALGSDVMAAQVAQTAGKPGEMDHPEEENVSVLQALSNKKVDRLAELNALPPSLRAREAAAAGFATGTNGDRKMSDRYFDVAFSAVEKVWQDRATVKNAPDVVQEVSEAAAQVDAIDALNRAQRLNDKTASAISMIAVARVVSGQEAPQPVAEQ